MVVEVEADAALVVEEEVVAEDFRTMVLLLKSSKQAYSSTLVKAKQCASFQLTR